MQALQLGAVLGQAARQFLTAASARTERARLVGQHLLGAQLLGDVVDFLLAAQHAVLLESAA
jgi:hypothetical protein